MWGVIYDINSPPGVTSAKEYALIGWGDTRHSRGESGTVSPANPIADGDGFGGGVQDVYVSAAQFSAIGGGTSQAVKVVLAGVLGLVLVGLVLILVALASRRKAGPPPSRTVSGKEPAGVS